MSNKKGLIYRLTVGKENLPDFTPDRLPGTRFQLFKDVFFGRIGAMTKVNLLTLLFCLPAIAWIVVTYVIKLKLGSLLPYSGNVGVGYPIVTDVASVATRQRFGLNVWTYLVLIPCIMIASVGFSGAFYVMRRLVWGEGVGVASHFFHGIKKNFKQFLPISLIAGLSVFVLSINIGMYNVYTNIHVAWRVIFIIVAVIQFVIMFSLLIFYTTQAVTYKLKTWPLLKNSFLFAIALLPFNLLILVISLAPILLMMLLPMQVLMFFAFILALVGFSYIMCVWTVYAHWAYDKYVNDNVEGAVKNRGMYIKTPEEKRAAEERERKNKNIRFNNPKKRAKKVKSIDEGETFTPLVPTFSRADLARLEEEKEAVKRSIDADYEDTEDTDESAAPEQTETADQTPDVQPESVDHAPQTPDDGNDGGEA